MRPASTDWHAVAMAKLQHVMGARAGDELARTVLKELELEAIASPEDLRRFATALGMRGGFAAAVGGLLGVHAAMYGGADGAPTVRTG